MTTRHARQVASGVSGVSVARTRTPIRQAPTRTSAGVITAPSAPALAELRRHAWIRRALCALAVVAVIGVAATVMSIERDLERRVEAALVGDGLVGIDVSISGQDVALRCGVPIDDPDAVVAIVSRLRGVRQVQLQASCATGSPGGFADGSARVPVSTSSGGAVDDVAEPFGIEVSARFDEGRLVLSGTVIDEAARDRLVAAAAASLDPANIDDRLSVASERAAGSGVPSRSSSDTDDLAGMAALIRAMTGHLVSGEAVLDNGRLSLTGLSVGDAELAIVQRAATDVGASLSVTERPVASAADAATVTSLLNRIVQDEPILFEAGSAVLSVDAEAVVDRIAAVANRYDGVAIEVVGHTDSRGDAADNLELSRDRADSVREALEARGVTTIVRAFGRGELEPILVGGVEDLVASRRVEFVVTASSS
jgi:OmpA-OmpF porin, OOP family